MPHRKVPPTNRRFGKAMRQHMTDAEARLWLRLRKPGIEGLRFRRQVPIGPYIGDFFCPQHRLIVEVDGGQHDAASDRGRDAWLTARDYRVVRVWNNDVMENVEGVCEAISSASREVAVVTPSRNR
jgi:very-short-patch-repair endonuclease